MKYKISSGGRHSVWLPEDVHLALLQAAEKLNKTKNSLVVDAVREYLAKWLPQKQGK